MLGSRKTNAQFLVGQRPTSRFCGLFDLHNAFTTDFPTLPVFLGGSARLFTATGARVEVGERERSTSQRVEKNGPKTRRREGFRIFSFGKLSYLIGVARVKQDHLSYPLVAVQRSFPWEMAGIVYGHQPTELSGRLVVAWSSCFCPFQNQPPPCRGCVSSLSVEEVLAF